VVALVGGRQDLRLVDHVRTRGLEYLGLRGVTDPDLPHHRDRHLFDDLRQRGRVGHPGDPAALADVRRHRLQVHHRHRAHVLGDPRLRGVDDVHHDAALLHLREPAFDHLRPALQIFEIGILRHVRPLDVDSLIRMDRLAHRSRIVMKEITQMIFDPQSDEAQIFIQIIEE